MKTNTTSVEWRALYQTANELREIEPWKWVEETDIFGVQNPATGEIGYCCIMGELGEVLGMAVYLGTEGLQGYKDIYGGKIAPDGSDMMFTQNCLFVSFEDKDYLQEEDKALIKETGLKFRGRRRWPMFRRQEPGYVPWFFDNADVLFMTEVMRQAKEISLRLRKDDNLLRPVAEGTYLVRVPDSGGISWKDAWLKPVPARQKVFAPIVVLDDLRLQRMKKNSGSSACSWEVDFFYSLTPVEAERPYFPYAMMVAESETGYVNDIYLAGGQNYAAEFSERMISCIEKAEKMPSEIRVKREEVFSLLQPIAKKLCIALRQVDETPAVEEARRSIERRFQDGDLLPDEYCGDEAMEECLAPDQSSRY